MKKNVFYVAISIDTDSDFFDPSLVSGDPPAGLQWRGIEQGIPLLASCLRGYRDDFGSTVKFTWFVRADSQLTSVYGHAGYLLRKYKATWMTLAADGDEIGWHPHLYKKLSDRWIQETRASRLSASLRQSYQAMREEGFSPISSRIGESFQSNLVLTELARLRIKVDSTAMPGRVRLDAERSIDWQGTPSHPYYPSKADYRVPGEGKERVAVLEVPMSMVETQVEYDQRPLRRYVDLSFHSSVIRESLQAYVGTSHYLVSITHPSAVLPIYKRRHHLISFDVGEVKRNFEVILSTCAKLRKRVRFLTVSEFLNEY